MLPLHRNGCSSTVACVFVAARMCLATLLPSNGYFKFIHKTQEERENQYFRLVA
jgi:hypothetical protein